MNIVKDFFEGIKEYVQEAIEFIVEIEEAPYRSKSFLLVVYYALWRGISMGMLFGLYEHYISKQNGIFAGLFIGISLVISIIIILGLIPMGYRWVVKIKKKTMKTKNLIVCMLLLLGLTSCSSYNSDNAKVLIKNKVPKCMNVVQSSEKDVEGNIYYAAVDSTYKLHIFWVSAGGNVHPGTH